MPYQTCPGCGLRTYYVSGEECPRCGTPLGETRRPAGQPEWRADAEPRGAVEIVLWATGNGRTPAFVPGASAPLRDTICQRLLDGTIENIVHDAAADPRVRDLPVVRATGVGAYIGVPLTGAAARRYVLCCLAGEARPDLSERDVRFLRGLVESVRPAVDRA